MNKELIEKILVKNNISREELNQFISEYTFKVLNRNISSMELSGIVQAIQAGIFNLRYAATQAALSLGLYVLSVYTSEGLLIRTLIYEDS